MSRGGKREGAGRKPAPSKQLRVSIELIKELENIEGLTYSKKIKKLLNFYKENLKHNNKGGEKNEPNF